MKKYVVLMLVTLIAVCLNAEIVQSAFTPSLFSTSFLKQNNISMNHSMSFSAGTASGDNSFYQSVYTNHIKYKLNSKLNLQLDLNFVNYGSATFDNWEFDSNNDNQTKVLPNFQLNYQPNENMRIQFEFRNYRSPGNFNRDWSH